MSRIPRILPLAGVAVVGVIAINALAGARDLPGLVSGAQAWAEGVAAKAQGKDAKADPKADPKAAEAPKAASPLPPRAETPAAGAAVAALPGACTPTDASIGREAGLSPEQMRLLESLQTRRGQLDDREKTVEMQLSLLAAAEAKLDQRINTLNGLKGDITKLLNQADEKQKAETARMVGVYTTMAQQKPKEAAKQLTIMDDKVRLPIAAGLSNRTLATILANMSPADATKLNEALVRRYENQNPLEAGKAAIADKPAPAAAPAAATPPAKAAAATAAPKAPVAAAPADPKAAPVKTAQAVPPQAAPKPKKPAPKPAAKKPDPADGAAPMKTEPEPAAAKPQAGG